MRWTGNPTLQQFGTCVPHDPLPSNTQQAMVILVQDFDQSPSYLQTFDFEKPTN